MNFRMLNKHAYLIMATENVWENNKHAVSHKERTGLAEFKEIIDNQL